MNSCVLKPRPDHWSGLFHFGGQSMFYEIHFGKLSALLVDFVDQPDGFFYLRMAGAEPTVNAIWAYLSAKDSRRQKWSSAVQIPAPGKSYPHRVAAEKSVTYRTLRARLPSGMVDMAMIHPRLTVAEDNEQGFFLLTDETGVPTGFFARLNKCLAIPIRANWTDWLWIQGQQLQVRWTVQTETHYEGNQPVETQELVETSERPITRLDSLGQVACYRVTCAGESKAAWLQIIRQNLELGIRLHQIAADTYRSSDGIWTAQQDHEGWKLHRTDAVVVAGQSLNFVLAAAAAELGVHLIIEPTPAGEEVPSC